MMKKNNIDLAIENMSDEEVLESFEKLMKMNGEELNDFKDSLKIADDQKLTETDLNVIKTYLRDSKSDDAKFLANLPSSKGVSEAINNTLEDTVEEVSVSVDPNSGSMFVNPDTEELDKEMARLLDVDIEELYKLPESSSDIPYDPELVKTNASEYGIDESDIMKLLPVIDKYRAGEELNWYKEMPDGIKAMINKQCIELNNVEMATKKLLAKEIIIGLIRDAGIDRLTIDLQQVAEEAFDISGIMKMTLDYQNTLLETKFLETAEKLESEGKQDQANTIKAVSNAYRESYTYEKFIEVAKTGKLRVKDFDVKKYRRYISDFNYKYEKDTPFTINDLSSITPILLRKFPQFETNHIIRFVIAFCKYCMNMDSKDVIDHTYMSYAIINISNLDLVVKEQEEDAFITVLTKSIEESIKIINNL